ncbi:MAG: hypothetical protein AAB903_03540 [Patescibacteria group bacterium]
MKCYFLPEDIVALRTQIDALHRKLTELGREQGEAAAQSSENMGHDDACQESIYYARGIVVQRLNDLERAIGKAEVVHPRGPFQRVQIGATVTLSDGRSFKIGSFMIFANHPTPTISYASPLAQAMMSRVVGEEFEFRNNLFNIVALE